jgi:hypothetical protein
LNQLTPYEKLIAGKTAALPVPDMADEIWARIEAQLDAPPDDDPQDEGPGSEQPVPRPPKTPSPVRLKRLLPAAAGAAALFVILWTARKKESQETPQQATPPAAVITDTGLPGNSLNADTAATPGLSPPPPSSVRNIFTDTGSGQPVQFPALNDSVPPPFQPGQVTDSQFVQPPPAVPPADNRQPDTSGREKPGGKKPKGVTGITDSDYKIVPQRKDSVKKN